MADETPLFTRVAVGHQFNSQHRPRPTAAGLAGTPEAVGRPRKAPADTAEL